MSMGNLRKNAANKVKHQRLDSIAQNGWNEVTEQNEQYRHGEEHLQSVGYREQGLSHSR